MKTTLQTRLVSFALAALMTAAMLGGVNALATSEADSQMAQASTLVQPST